MDLEVEKPKDPLMLGLTPPPSHNPIPALLSSATEPEVGRLETVVARIPYTEGPHQCVCVVVGGGGGVVYWGGGRGAEY